MLVIQESFEEMRVYTANFGCKTMERGHFGDDDDDDGMVDLIKVDSHTVNVTELAENKSNGRYQFFLQCVHLFSVRTGICLSYRVTVDFCEEQK
jgi:hypothetical protein